MELKELYHILIKARDQLGKIDLDAEKQTVALDILDGRAAIERTRRGIEEFLCQAPDPPAEREFEMVFTEFKMENRLEIPKSGIVDEINKMLPINWAKEAKYIRGEFKEAVCDKCGGLPIKIINTDSGKALCKKCALEPPEDEIKFVVIPRTY